MTADEEAAAGYVAGCPQAHYAENEDMEPTTTYRVETDPHIRISAAAVLFV